MAFFCLAYIVLIGLILAYGIYKDIINNDFKGWVYDLLLVFLYFSLVATSFILGLKY